MMTVDDRRPWLNSSGAPLSDAELRAVSQNWPLEIWERYAETLESPQTELMTAHYDALVRDLPSEWEDSSSQEMGEELPDYAEFKTAFAELPNIDQAILEASVLDRMAEDTIAKKYGITRRKVITSRKRSISLLESRLNDSLVGILIFQNRITHETKGLTKF